jgi:hypothetical protein
LKFKPFNFSTNLIGKIIETEIEKYNELLLANRKCSKLRTTILHQSNDGVSIDNEIFISYKDLLLKWQFTEEYTDIFNHTHSECGIVDYDNN